MIQLTPLQHKLFTLLNDTNAYTDIELSLLLKTSTSDIKQQIKTLETLKLPYESSYPITLLCKNTITHYLENLHFLSSFTAHVFASIDSTNQFLKKLPEDSNLHFCCAETQTAGRGRFNRQWFSPCAENVALSLRFQLPNHPLSGLSLVVGLSVCTTLQKLNIYEDIQIKWPNDILWKGKKLCGILIELQKMSYKNIQTIIGIGLNVNFDTQSHPLQEKAWCSMYEITQKRFDRNALIAELIVQLYGDIQLFLKEGLSVFLKDLQKMDGLINQSITVLQHNLPLKGIARGINKQGELLLEDEQGQLHMLSSGEASLRHSGVFPSP